MGCYYGGGWVVLWLLLKVLEGGLVLFVVLSMRTLQAGAASWPPAIWTTKCPQSTCGGPSGSTGKT